MGVLRGNRCVLVRSLSGAWKGMKIPSLLPMPSEMPIETAIRCVVHYMEVESEEVEAIPDVPSVDIFTQRANGKPLRVQLYALYATSPPPDGPLEDADIEDDEWDYDWYTFPNAIRKLDTRCIAGLQAMALILLERANVGLLPCKWGGVFGQELQLTILQNEGCAPTTLTGLAALKEEWKVDEAAQPGWIVDAEDNADAEAYDLDDPELVQSMRKNKIREMGMAFKTALSIEVTR